MMMCPHSEQDVTWYNLTLLCPGRACIACWLGEKFPKLVLAGLGWAGLGWAGLAAGHPNYPRPSLDCRAVAGGQLGRAGAA